MRVTNFCRRRYEGIVPKKAPDQSVPRKMREIDQSIVRESTRALYFRRIIREIERSGYNYVLSWQEISNSGTMSGNAHCGTTIPPFRLVLHQRLLAHR